MITRAEGSLAILERLLEGRTGQRISASRASRIEGALAPVMADFAIPDIDALAAVIVAHGDRTLAERCVEAMLNNETSFYRDQAAFAQLLGPVMDHFREVRATTRRIRIWSAACSTGQELLSIAMNQADQPHRFQDWSIELFGTDVSAAAIERARAGVYSQFEIQRGLPITSLVRHFEQVGEQWVAKAALRKRVRLAVANLLEAPPATGQDIVLARNVLMYLDIDTRRAAFDRLASAMAPDGLLMLGAAETVIGQTDRFVASERFRGFYERTPQG